VRSLLFVANATPFVDLPTCGPGRQEIPITLRKGGRIYRFIIRDKVTVEDPYLVIVKARAFAIRTGEAFSGQAPSRTVRDFLIKSSVVI
jgi:hypothetical protein